MSKEAIKSLRTTSPVGKIFDFPDFFSPMFVKELRQGLRGKGFIAMFMVMQALLCISILLSLSFGDAGSSTAISTTIHILFTIVVCGIQPMRGTSALNNEIKNDTIDLIMITNLSAWKIVFGKWISLVAQSAIFAVSLLPYLILRYFLGDMLLFSELALFAFVFFTGSISTAIAIGGSALTSAILRFITSSGLVIVILMYTLMFVSAGVAGNMALTTIISGTGSTLVFIVLLFSMIISMSYIGWLALDFGASAIAPISENRSTTRRIIYSVVLGLGFLIVSITSLMYMIDPSWVESFCEPEAIVGVTIIISLILFVPFFIVTVVERQFVAESAVIQLKANKPLKLLRKFLYPGWASGWLFICVCMTIMVAMLACAWFIIDFDEEEFFLIFTSVISSLSFAALLLTLIKRNAVNRFAGYIICLVSTYLFGIFITIFSSSVNKSIAHLFCWVPSVGVFRMTDYKFKDEELYIVINIITLIISLVLVYFISRQSLKNITLQEKKLKNAELEKNNTNSSTGIE